MDTIRLVIVTAIISLPLLQGVVGNLQQKPENAAGIVGNSVVLRCQGVSDSSTFVTWQHHSKDMGVITLAVDGSLGPSPNKEFYNITGDASVAEYNLVINLQLVVAGRYRCYEQFGTRSEALAHVTVLESDPSCFTNVENNVTSEGEDIVLSCELYYGSSTIDWAPKIEWSKNNQPILDVINASVQFEKVNVTYKVPASGKLDGSEYLASIKFPALESPPDDHAENTPDYHYEQSFGPFIVHYGASNIKLINSKGLYCPGDKVTCDADGNPEVKYRWHNRRENTTQEGAVLEITNEMKDKTYEFRCFAFNDIGNTEHVVSEDIEFTVTCRSGLPVGAYIGIAIAAVVVVVCIGVVICVVVNKKKKTHAME